jgi:WhiB family transcriptional regulator, redox-sensing transcriptional regulator
LMAPGPAPDRNAVLRELLHRPEWHQRAACRGLDVSHFYRIGAPSPVAAGACRRCEVRSECLATALEAHDDFGVWGGVDGERRRKVLRRTVA